MQPSLAETFDVVVSGASFAGLALARALSLAFQGDIRIGLIDRAPIGVVSPASEDPRASAIAAGSRQMLKALGVWEHVADRAQPVESMAITDSALENAWRPVVLGYDNRLPDGSAATHILENAHLMAALSAVAVASPGVVAMSPAQVTGFDCNARGVQVHLSTGASLSAHLLVSAEGRISALRERAGIKIVTWDYDQIGIVSLVAHERPHDGVAVQHFLPGGPFAILPLTPDLDANGRLRNRSCVTWSEAATVGKAILAYDDSAFLREIEQRFGHKLGPLALAGSRRSWPLAMHLARSYVAERFALIGDAAHGVHPIAGQGLNLALRDVAALTEVLVETGRVGLDLGSADALARYERWRRLDSAVSAAAFDGLNRLFSNDWPVLRGLRDAGLGIVDRMPGLKQLLVSEAAGLTGEVPSLLRGEMP